jgi:hypothetical protein
MMAENEQPDVNYKEGKAINAYAKYTGMAFQMIVIIGIFAFAGYKIDEAASTIPNGLQQHYHCRGIYIIVHCYQICKKLKITIATIILMKIQPFILFAIFVVALAIYRYAFH